jgi:hypothetical protein
LHGGLPEKLMDGQHSSSKKLKWFGIGATVSGLLLNEVVLARYASRDGILDTSTLSNIRIFQAILVIGGVLIIMKRDRMAALLHTGISRLDQTGKTKLLAISLLVPWTVALLITDSERLSRSWWMWPLQVVVIASVVTYLPTRLGAPRWVMWIGLSVLLSVLAVDSLLFSRLQAWGKDGWSGKDSAETRSLDYVATMIRSDGKQQARIGYEIYTYIFPAVFHTVDPRYKIGASFDAMLKYRHGIVNLDRCAEGVSPDDEYRIVQISPFEDEIPGASNFLDVLHDSKFKLMGQFGVYQVFKAH